MMAKEKGGNGKGDDGRLRERRCMGFDEFVFPYVERFFPADKAKKPSEKNDFH